MSNPYTAAPDRPEPRLVLVESNTTGTGRRFCAAARRRGLHPVILARDPARYPYIVEDGITAVALDTGDKEAVLAECRRLATEAGLAGVTSSSEYFIATAATVAAELGLPAPDAEAVRRCRDKALQRALLERSGVSVPRHRTVGGSDEAVYAAEELGLPVVVKPVAGSGSVGVKLCRTAEETAVWAGRLCTEAELGAADRILVEEFVEGPEFSVETLDGTVAAVIGKHLGPPPHFVETGHDYPAPAEPAEREALGETALAALRALGLGWGAAHTELRMTDRGPVVIEVNPRLAGGMIPVMIQAAAGTDLVDTVIARAAGQPLPDRGSGTDHGAIRFLLEPGTVRIDAVRPLAGSLPGSPHAAELTVIAGTAVTAAGSFKDRLGYVVCTGPDTPAAGAAAEQALGGLRRALSLTRLDGDVAAELSKGGR
ncbi:ATP-grasp domain-containing protein [Kitasatospora sp. NPDC036755]|uniref:ATP-grasp domain-containing protein n=1 Tax=Kitasatospora sp. NPDC036755 TaxID=3154600 RepID=UPI0033F41EA6